MSEKSAGQNSEDSEPLVNQRATRALSEELTEARKLLDSGVHNEDNLREASAAAEDLAFRLEDVEAELVTQIKLADAGPRGSDTPEEVDVDG